MSSQQCHELFLYDRKDPLAIDPADYEEQRFWEFVDYNRVALDPRSRSLNIDGQASSLTANHVIFLGLLFEYAERDYIRGDGKITAVHSKSLVKKYFPGDGTSTLKEYFRIRPQIWRHLIKIPKKGYAALNLPGLREVWNYNDTEATDPRYKSRLLLVSKITVELPYSSF